MLSGDEVQLDVYGCVCIFSIGRPKHVRVMEGALEGDLFLGPEAEVCYFFILYT